MTNEKVFAMPLGKIYPALIAKAERKGRTRDEVMAVTAWLTGYTHGQIEELLASGISYGDFFRQAPALNPARRQIKGAVCGVRVETIGDPLMQEIRYLDKLVDELAMGRSMEKILRASLDRRKNDGRRNPTVLPSINRKSGLQQTDIVVGFPEDMVGKQGQDD